MQKLLIKYQLKLLELKKIHDDLVSLEFELEEEIFDLEYVGSSTTRLNNKLSSVIDKCFYNTDKQNDLMKLIKNLKAKIKRKII